MSLLCTATCVDTSAELVAHSLFANLVPAKCQDQFKKACILINRCIFKLATSIETPHPKKKQDMLIFLYKDTLTPTHINLDVNIMHSNFSMYV